MKQEELKKMENKLLFISLSGIPYSLKWNKLNKKINDLKKYKEVKWSKN